MSTSTDERPGTARAAGDWLRLGTRLTTLVIVLAVIVGGVLAWRAVSRPFAEIGTEVRPDDDYSLTIEGGTKPGGHMTVVNNTDSKLRLHVFNADDTSKTWARENIVIPAGERVPIDKVPSVFNIWKSQIFDAHITWTRTVYDDTIVINGNGDRISIDAASAETRFVNTVGEHLKVCTYQVWDPVQFAPLQCWTLAPNQSDPIVWSEPPGEFVVKVFHPQLVDDLVTVRENVPAGATITIRKG